MPTFKRIIALYVDKPGEQWVARDNEGNLWSLPPTPTPWDDRKPFEPTNGTELEPVPGHYKCMLDLPIQA